MNSLIYYNQLDIYTEDNIKKFPQLAKYSSFAKAIHSGIAVVDRSGTIELPYRTENLYPFPEWRTFTDSFKDIAIRRVLEIEKDILSDPDTQPVLMYSGGIDSTLVASLIIQYCSKEFKDRLLVILNEASIDEARDFYEKHIKRNFRMASSNRFEQYLNNKYKVITGEFADNVFGSLTLKFSIDFFGSESIINDPYQKYAHTYFNRKINDSKLTDWFIDQIEPLIKTCPYEIKTWNDYLWYMNFAMKWQAVEFRILSHKEKEFAPDWNYLNNNLIHFWKTDEWEQWAVNNPDKKIGNTWTSYKQPAKDLIYEFAKDEDYLLNKTKYPSLPGVFRYRRVNKAIDKDLNFLNEINIEDFIK